MPTVESKISTLFIICMFCLAMKCSGLKMAIARLPGSTLGTAPQKSSHK